MSIKPSASAEIRTLIAALAATDDVRRESAIARLAIIGPRAIERILAAYPSAAGPARVAILRTLEAIGDARALVIAREALAQAEDEGVAAAGTLRALLDSPNATAATEALDALVAAVLDTSRRRRVRLAALDALQDMPFHVRERIQAALRQDTDPLVRARATDTPAESASIDAAWQDALEGRPGEDAAVLRDAIRVRSQEAPLSILQRLVDAIREREDASPDPRRREEWLATRGAIHQALALRGSRIAVYDLRESVEAAAGPLPPSFVAALHAVGDESCLPAVAAAHKRAADERWRVHLEAAFEAIVKREKLGRKKSARLLAREGDGSTRQG